MKVIKLELHEVPDSFAPRTYERVAYPKISAKLISDLEPLSYMESPVVTKELYDLQGLALGRLREWFYIRKRDQDALESIMKGFIQKTKRDLLESLLEYKEKDLPGAVWEMKKKLDEEEDFLNNNIE